MADLVDTYFLHLADRMDNAVRIALDLTRIDAYRLLLSRIPDFRVLTRKALKVTVRRSRRGYELRSRLHFSRRYRQLKGNNSTLRIFYAAWRDSRDEIAGIFHRHLTEQLNTF